MTDRAHEDAEKRSADCGRALEKARQDAERKRLIREQVARENHQK